MASFKLRVIWGNDNSQRLTFSDGMPASLNVLSKKIENECGLQGQQFRLQYMDKDFNEFMNLTSVSDLADKDTVRVVFFTSSSSSSSHMPDEFSSLAHCNSSESCDADNEKSSAETSDADIFSSTSVRSSLWPTPFILPRFPYDVQLKLDQGNSAFRTNGKVLIPDPKLKSGILDALAEEIINYKAYPSDSEFSDVAEALVAKHPCLKEQGSASGYSGWKISLKFKLANYRSKLRRLGCPEVTMNALKHKPEGKHSPAYGIKKPKKAEVNYCPVFPAGETGKPGKDEGGAHCWTEEKKQWWNCEEDDGHDFRIQKGRGCPWFPFSRRRQKQMACSFSSAWGKWLDVSFLVWYQSWPVCLCWIAHKQDRCNLCLQINAEFRRITTLPLQTKFLSQLDRFSDDLLKVFTKKGGVIRKRIQDVMVPMSQVVFSLFKIFKFHFFFILLFNASYL